MTDQELKDLVASLAISQDRTGAQLAKTDKQLSKTDNRSASLHEEQKKTENILRNLEKLYGGFADNDGRVVEEYFLSGLKKNKKLHNGKYNIIAHREKNKLGKDFDITLYNGKKVVCLEVKKVIHKNDVINFLEKGLLSFKNHIQDSKTYGDHDIYGGIAGFVINEDAKKITLNHGLIILTKEGKGIIELTSNIEIKKI